MIYDVIIDSKSYRLEFDRVDGRSLCRLDGRTIEADAVMVRPDVLSLRIGDRSYEVKIERAEGAMQISLGGHRFVAEVRDPRSLRGRTRAADEHGPKNLTASMPGKVVRVLVAEGNEIEAGAGMVVVEAMKMQNEVKSPKKGIIQKILVSEGTTVSAGDVLAIVE